ncbi:MAG TPA: hypothetical protein VF269_01175 [Rhodanobacteraceae bacterium]
MYSGQIFVLLIIIICVGAGTLRHYMRLRERQPREDPHYQSRIQALEERVKTLERIVTDKNYDLKREFDRL